MTKPSKKAKTAKTAKRAKTVKKVKTAKRAKTAKKVKTAKKAKPAAKKAKPAAKKAKPAAKKAKPAAKKKAVAKITATEPIINADPVTCCCCATAQASGDVTAHGAELIDAVIAKVEAEGLEALGTCGLPKHPKPRPVPSEVLEKLTFPDGKPLSPALKRWLAYDASWLGWFDDPVKPVFKPQKLGAYAQAEYDMDWGFGELEVVLGGDCYPLHFGCDSRRFLYVGERDSSGEYPVLLLDTDDVPYIGVEYPGIDVYLADNAGVISLEQGCYGDTIKSVTYAPRMTEHADRYFAGQVGLEMGEYSIKDGQLVVTPFDCGGDDE